MWTVWTSIEQYGLRCSLGIRRMSNVGHLHIHWNLPGCRLVWRVYWNNSKRQKVMNINRNLLKDNRPIIFKRRVCGVLERSRLIISFSYVGRSSVIYDGKIIGRLNKYCWVQGTRSISYHSVLGHTGLEHDRNAGSFGKIYLHLIRVIAPCDRTRDVRPTPFTLLSTTTVLQSTSVT